MNIQLKKNNFLRLSKTEFESLAKTELQKPQVDCPVVHRFGPGIYIREIFVPAGTFIIGHYHKYAHTNIMLKGKATLVMEDGTISQLQAPFLYVGTPGRKMAHVHEDMVWQNIYATDETDIEKLEEMLLIKGEVWNEHTNLRLRTEKLNQKINHDDYEAMLIDIGYSKESVKEISGNETDQIPFPMGNYKVMVSASPIEGKGLFATAFIEPGEIIAPARIDGKRTPAGRFVNHAKSPNARMVILPSGDLDLVAMKHIFGCQGGNLGEEITIDYRKALMESQKYMRNS